MAEKDDKKVRVLIVYFSLSGQSRGLINLLASGLKQAGVDVTIEKIIPMHQISFPFGSFSRTVQMMLATFLKKRYNIKDINPFCFQDYDLTCLAGPTWSYNPSGPMLSFLDRYAQKLLKGRRILPIISCRGYYRLHNFQLRKKLLKSGALLEKSLIFSHPVAEPWSTVGVFLKMAGKQPEKMRFLSSHYPHYGHTVSQLQQIREHGRKLGEQLRQERTKTSAHTPDKTKDGQSYAGNKTDSV